LLNHGLPEVFAHNKKLGSIDSSFFAKKLADQSAAPFGGQYHRLIQA